MRLPMRVISWAVNECDDIRNNVLSTYELSKLLREVNRNPHTRQKFMTDAASVVADFKLTPEEAKAVIERDIGALYKLGVHGLILRPFTLIHNVSEPDYLAAIRS
jgi:Aromatic-ring-opening dioxygenase LigAB, LigA subunit